MAARKSLVSKLIDWVGPATLHIRDLQDGWPSLLAALTPTGNRNVAVHVGSIGASGRDRDEVERRFQNPATRHPVQSPQNEIPLLLGLSDEIDGKRLIVGMETKKRIGKETRVSLFMPLHLLQSGATSGWAEHFSNSGERLIAFTPSLFPAYVELCRTETSISDREVQAVIQAAGAAEPDAPTESLERGMRLTMRIIRDAAFSKNVRSSYGDLCAMCGLNFSLVAGAHIYPVSAPNSADTIWNGLALCHNHHAAFDNHQIWVDPRTHAVVLHDDMSRSAQRNRACAAFVETTLPQLRLPEVRANHPRSEMFTLRYEYFSSKYSWAPRQE